MFPPFEPAPWTAGGHRQTLLGHWSRRHLTWSPPTEDVLVARDLAPSGGHVGFVAPTEAPGRFWAAERALGCLAEKLHASETPGAPQRG
jgi:hypothetical protein